MKVPNYHKLVKKLGQPENKNSQCIGEQHKAQTSQQRPCDHRQSLMLLAYTKFGR